MSIEETYNGGCHSSLAANGEWVKETWLGGEDHCGTEWRFVWSEVNGEERLQVDLHSGLGAEHGTMGVAAILPLDALRDWLNAIEGDGS